MELRECGSTTKRCIATVFGCMTTGLRPKWIYSQEYGGIVLYYY